MIQKIICATSVLHTFSLTGTVLGAGERALNKTKALIFLTQHNSWQGMQRGTIYRVLQGTSFPLADSNISVG